MAATRDDKQRKKQSSAPQKRQTNGGGGFLARLTDPFRRLVVFLRDVRVEMSRVVWPSKEETYTYTLVVVVAVVVVAAWVGFWDTLFTQLVAALNLYK